MSSPEGDDQNVGTRWPELGVAAFLMLLAVLVIVDSIRVGTGWADDGPRSGYFPFYIGSLLLLSSGWIFLSQLLRWSRDRAVFADRSQLMLVLAVLWPMCVYVGLIYPLGIYLPSTLLIAYFMKRYGGYRWPAIVGVSIAVPLVFFAVFERWFLVPLPKGPIEHLLGL